MDKRIKSIALVIIGIAIVLISIRALFNFLLIPNTQKKDAISSYTQNVDKFEKVSNYLIENYSSKNSKTNKYFFIRCSKDELSKELKIYRNKFNKNGESEKVEMQIEDMEVLQQVKYILYDLNFEYIENIGDDVRFVFRDKNGHFQCINYTTEDITKIKVWNTTKLKDNWYYLSIWTSFLRSYEEPLWGYFPRVIYHVIKGY